jgi:sulfur-oxidizing protein SoxZ
MARVLMNVPKRARKGETVELKLLIAHPMESGFRRDATGQPLPRHIIKDVVCTWNGEEVFRAELFPAIAANPFLSFRAVALDSGTIVMRWADDRGAVEEESATVTVE